MTIRRQYSLPNCTLILDGLSDGNPNTGIADPRPVMSSLYNAECHFVGCEQPLFGGKDFLTSLVGTVSSYTQELLSGAPPHAATIDDTSLVSLARADRKDFHTLNANPDLNSKETGSTGLLTDGKPTQIQLSTVQLFDLVEAIDRFLADKRTLPDLKIPLKPVPKTLVQPMSAQATSAGVGLAGLVLASLIGYVIPAPKVSAPKFVDAAAPIVAPKDASTSKPDPIVIPTPEPSPSPSTSPSPSSEASDKGAKIVDGTQLGFLNRKLRRDLNQNWENRRQITQASSFRVSMNSDGEIVSYQPSEGNSDTKLADMTPLPKLVKENPDAKVASGDFRVVFTPEGVLQISPWDGRRKGTSMGKEIADPKMEKILAENLQAQLEKEVGTDKPTYPKDVKYRVGVTGTGDIVDYEPAEAGAYDAESKTPLPKLVKFSPLAATSEEPLARYVVTFQRDGKVLVVK